MDKVLSEKLDELILVTRAASFSDRYLDAVGVGALLSVEPRYVLERLACRPDFPKPASWGQPRWKASEVMEWADAQRAPIRRKSKRISQAAAQSP